MSTKKKFSVRRAWQRVRTVPGLKRDVGALVVLIALAVVATLGIQSFLGGSGLFSHKVEYKAEFADVTGLNPDATTHFVSVAGVRLGRVSSWEPTNRGTAIVTMELTPPFGTIYDNATAVLRPKNPLNDMSITISPGGPPGRPLPEGGLIPVQNTKRPIQVNEALSHLDEKTQAAVNELMTASDIALASAPTTLPGGFQATDATLATLRPVMTALQTRRDNIAQLVTALGDIASAFGADHQRAVTLADTAERTLRVLADNDRNLASSLRELPGLNSKLRDAMSETQHLTKQLNPTLDNLREASDELPDALDKFHDTTKQLDKTIDVAKPFLAVAKPVIADLRPIIFDVHDSLDELHPVTKNLDRDTKVVGTYLTMIQAFIMNTASVFGVHDAQGGNIRGHVEFKAPDGPHFLPGGDPGFTPRPPDAGTGPGPISGATPLPHYVPGADDYDPGYNERHGMNNDANRTYGSY
ncbi:MlaD family protein [Pseudonocardia sp. Cha107L01]|uniref:MlaD family protein n=1 Tax=Pseudonocardia sp. Cha107L01 TaxID=3457576 RepID=UPI00403EB008